ncbi:hypothetical protein IC229_03490 [Spirosoma sp. BT702]|uniref:Uncharacterized protein n=1 Tax=Spirosoma profusum TaxID=2771354 RepID=A0A927AQ59_9BACT|nr:hypothetical protein [Spirosoma profusum]MBD2699686.1 hypothetical protein [Spirosoma profusum]
MKKHTEKQPIDDLFARKLGDMSLRPSADGFERLQARMGQQTAETRLVFWRNPAMQRYVSAAACLVLVCTLGWRYWPNSDKAISGGPNVAVNKSQTTRPKNPVNPATEVLTKQSSSDDATSAQPATLANEQTQLVAKTPSKRSKLTTQPIHEQKSVGAPERSEPVLAKIESTQSHPTIENARPNVAQIDPMNSGQIASPERTVKPIAASERVLVVTIAEPEALAAARQDVKEVNAEKSIADTDQNPEKSAKTGGLWNQVKRFKEGEIFARRDNQPSEDRGLLSRAYTGLKHSLEKDKSTKQ